MTFVFPEIDWSKPVDLCAACAFLISRYGVEYAAPDGNRYPIHDPRMALEMLPDGSGANGLPFWDRLRLGPFSQVQVSMRAVATVAGTRLCGPHIGTRIPDLGSIDTPRERWA